MVKTIKWVACVFATVLAFVSISLCTQFGGAVRADSGVQALWGSSAQDLTSSGTLAEAFADRPAYVKLQSDVSIASTLNLDYAASTVLDLNGKEISGTVRAFNLSGGNSLTVKDSATGGVIKSNDKLTTTVWVTSGCTFTLEGGEVLGVGTAVGTFEGTLNLLGGVVRNIAVTGEISNSSSAVTVSKGRAVVENCQVTVADAPICFSCYPDVSTVLDLSNARASGYNIGVINTSGSYAPGKEKLPKSSIIMPLGWKIYDWDGVEVTSDSLNQNASYKLIGPVAAWGVDENSLTGFGTITQALEARPAYVKLNANADIGESTLYAYGPLTVELNGKTITSSINRAPVLEIVEGKLTVKDSATGGGIIASGQTLTSGVSVCEGAELSLEGGSINVQNGFGISVKGKTTLSGGSVTAGNYGISIFAEVTVIGCEVSGGIYDFYCNSNCSLDISAIKAQSKTLHLSTNLASGDVKLPAGWVLHDIYGQPVFGDTLTNGEYTAQRYVEDISSASVSVSGEYRYNGQAIVPTVEVTQNGKVLVEGVDYTVEISNNVNVGYASVKVVGCGNYKGEAECVFEIKECIHSLGENTACSHCGAALTASVKSDNGEGVNYYPSVEKALESAKNGDIVSLLCDFVGVDSVYIPSGITFDGAGFKIDAVALDGAVIIDNGGTILGGVFGRATVNNYGTLSGGTFACAVNNYGYIRGGTFSAVINACDVSAVTDLTTATLACDISFENKTAADVVVGEKLKLKDGYDATVDGSVVSVISAGKVAIIGLHVHAYTKENNNESHHWKECACGERNADTVEAHTDESKNHECDACGRVVSTCEDNNFNHECDTCGEAMGTHEAGVGTHVCDWCGQSASTCEDTDGNCICDWCGQGVEHSHSSEWEKDDEKHWHECKCGDKADEQAHAFGEWNSENIRTCTDCGFEQARQQPNDSSSEGDSSIGGGADQSSGSEGNSSDGELGQGSNGESTSVSQPAGSAPWGVIALVAAVVAGAAVVVVIVLRKFKR